uniref:WW domain-containing protein n=1 Tax=Lotharella globosa TaxID=91324 RepID=A0A7S3Z6H4_9EUKA
MPTKKNVSDILEDPFFAKLEKKKKSQKAAGGGRVTEIAKDFEGKNEAEKRLDSNPVHRCPGVNFNEIKEFHENEIAARAKKTEVIKGTGKGRRFRRGRKKATEGASEVLAVAGIVPEEERDAPQEDVGDISQKDIGESRDDEEQHEALVTGAVFAAAGAGAAAEVAGHVETGDQKEEIEADHLNTEEQELDIEEQVSDVMEQAAEDEDVDDEEARDEDVHAIVGETLGAIVAEVCAGASVEEKVVHEPEEQAEYDAEDENPAEIKGEDLKLKKTYWRERVDPKTGKMYYYNKKTKKVQWERPNVDYKPVNKEEDKDNIGPPSEEQRIKRASEKKKAKEAKKKSSLTVEVAEKPFGMISCGQLVVNVWGDAEKAGLAIGDRLIRIKGKKVKSQRELKSLLSKAVLPYEIEYLPGDESTFSKAQKLQVKADLRLFRAGDPELEGTHMCLMCRTNPKIKLRKSREKEQIRQKADALPKMSSFPHRH